MGAKFVTIPLLVARVPKTGSQNTGKKTEEKKGDILGAGRGGEGERDLTVEVVPRHAFSDIWAQNRAFA